MPTIMTHAAAVLCGAKGLRLTAPDRKFWLILAACAMLPDADVAGFAFGIPYDSLAGHRGLSHSLLFAALLGPLVTTLAYSRRSLGLRHWALCALWFSLAAGSHGLLDMATDGGHGVAYFAPFFHERLFLPWRPIAVSPLGLSRFFSARGLEVLSNEFAVVLLPLLGFWGCSTLFHRLLQRPR